MKRALTFAVLILLPAGVALQGAETVKLLSLRGEVKVRRGLEEAWAPAGAGMRLEEIDTILTGETGTVTLQTAAGDRFTLGPNAMIDIADLHRITRRELFLYLMSAKIQKMPRPENTPLRVGNVSIVHGENRGQAGRRLPGDAPLLAYRRELNGAKFLLAQQYATNSALKLHKMGARFSDIEDCGERQFLLGKVYEALEMRGEALDAYAQVGAGFADGDCQNAEPQRWRAEALAARKRLQP